MSVDKYLGKRYRAGSYNCAHFVVDVWQDLTGKDLADTLSGFLTGPSSRHASLSNLRRVELLSRPVEPCIVFMQRRRDSHIGVWLRGRVLHLTEQGAQYVALDVATFGYKKVRFFHVN